MEKDETGVCTFKIGGASMLVVGERVEELRWQAMR